MNKSRRNAINVIRDSLDDARGNFQVEINSAIEALEQHLADEEEALDARPDAFRDGDKGDAMQAAVDAMQAALDSMQQASECSEIDDAMDSLDEACA